MHADRVCARLDEYRRVCVRVFNHKMMIEFDVRDAPDGFSNRRSHGEIRDKMAVHNVDVNHLDAGLLDACNFLTQAREVGCQYGGYDLNHSQLLLLAEHTVNGFGINPFRQANHMLFGSL